MSSQEMAQMAFGDPGFFDIIGRFLPKVATKLVGSIPIVGPIISAAVETLIPQSSQDGAGPERDDDPGEAGDD